jgi:trehalose 6-phosphate synthase
MTARKAAQAGGVAVALSDVMRATGGMWFGWSGDISPETPEQEEPEAVTILRDPRGGTLATLPVTESEHEGFYLGYSNSVLWPVFHNRLDLAKFEPGHYEVYSAFNRRVAKALAPLLMPDDLIWVHDYHFLPLAQELRNLGVQNRIGFFLHIAMPPPEVYLAIPQHRALSDALSFYNLVGLQTKHDTRNAFRCLHESVSAVRLDGDDVRINNRTFAIANFPIGIDPEFFKPSRATTALDGGGLIRAVGVDRLDYSKGLPQKFRAFKRLLEVHPEHVCKVQLTQIAAPTRESVGAYNSIRKELERLSGSVNGAFGDLDWVPVQYIHRASPRRKLPDIYRSARVALVTPLCDGMNLMAKEYVAAQDPADPGVLVLSQFAGAAEQLRAALIVNPHDIDGMAAALHQALMMELPERVQRHRAMMHSIETDGCERWWRSFVKRLGSRPAQKTDPAPKHTMQARF